MIQPEQVDAVIRDAVTNLNETLPDQERVELTPETVLFGIDADVDSLSLVSLVVDIESLLSDRHDVDVSLASEEAMSRPVLPFSSVTALREYILEKADDS
jgi:acyl carrier protein